MLWMMFVNELTFQKEKTSIHHTVVHFTSALQPVKLCNILPESAPLVFILVPPSSSVVAISVALNIN